MHTKTAFPASQLKREKNVGTLFGNRIINVSNLEIQLVASNSDPAEFSFSPPAHQE
jgi:hypothetical protein